MALTPKENQPFRFTSRNEYQRCVSDKSACNLLADGDDVYIQFDNTPCDEASLICDPSFGTAQGDLISNGNFDTSTAGWTVGATWTRNPAGYMTINNAASTTSLEQVIAASVENGHCYVVVFTISGWVAGSLQAQLGGTLGTAVSANGTYRQLIVAGAANERLDFLGPLGANMDLDDIELYDLGPCWCSDNGNVSVETGSGKLCHITGTATTISVVNTLPAIVAGRLYKVAITVMGMTQGSVHGVVGTAAVTDDFDSNGDHVDYVLADASNAFSVVFTDDFDGCITAVNVWEMTTDHDFIVTTAEGLAVGTITAFAQYTNDIVNLVFNTDDFVFDHGCYVIVAHDQCTGTFYESQCFNWQAEHAGTRQIIAIDRLSTDDNIRYSYGFMWVSNLFYLIQRLDLNFRKPTHSITHNSDRFSTGAHFKTYVEKSKIWELAIIDLDETKHDALVIQMHCRSMAIDGTEYFTQDEEYVPIYDENGFQTITSVKMLVTRKQDVLFSDNCAR